MRSSAQQELGCDPLSAAMDLEVTHHSVPLDFQRLYDFPPFDFAHDILEIARHLDRETGVLGGHLLPRCAKRDEPTG